ncbi:MAG: RNA 2',3'-cyclic phosphodiesterase [Methanimicrococcus sp.]|nr:RNA 2',3'-cyclic phosphodiesterase [Methanimicrococcus sp.]
MRLFIAVNFRPEIKQKFLDCTAGLKKESKGNFTPPENLHMTLVFIGETDRTAEIQETMNEAAATVKSEKLCFEPDTLGRFIRPGESLIWAGGASDSLEEIQRLLASALKKRGFDVDQRKWTPHVTLGRRVRFFNLKKDADIDAYLKSFDVRFSVDFDGISLMSSEHVNGHLVYREIYKVLVP